MAEFDAAAAKSAGYSDAEIAKVQQGISAARSAGYGDAEIQQFLTRTGGRVGAAAPAPAQPSPDTPLSAGGTAAALARGAAPYAAGAAIGSAIPGVGTATGVVGTGLWQLGSGIWNLLGLPHAVTPQEVTDKGLDAVGVQRPGNWLERGAEASGGLIASTVGAPPTPRPTSPPGPQQQLLRDFESQEVSPRVPTVGQGRGAALTSNIAKMLPFSGRAVQQAEREDVVATSDAAGRNAGRFGTAAEPDVAGARTGDAIRRWVEGLGAQARGASGQMGQAREAFDAGSVGRNALRRFASDTSQAKTDYGRFRGLMQGAPPVKLTNTNQLLDDLMGQFPNAPELEGLFQASPIAKAQSALKPRTEQIPATTSSMLDPYGRPIVTAPTQTVQRGGQLSWPEIERLRSDVGSRLENPTVGPDHIPRAELKRLYGALSQDMEIAAQARGPEALKALKIATGNYATRMNLIDRLEPLITGEAPERTFAKINSAALSGGSADAGLLRAAKANMSPAEWGDIGATIVSRLGEVRPGSKDAFASPNFSPAGFAENWGKLSTQAKDLLFGPTGSNTPRTALETLAKQATARQGLVKLVQTDNAESVFKNLNGAAGTGASANTGLLREARSVMTPQEWGDFGATVVARLGQPTKGAKDVLAEVEFSPSSFVTNWNGLSPKAKDILFGPDQPGTPRASLEQLTRVAQAQKNVSKLGNVSRSGEYLIGFEVAREALQSLWGGSVREIAGWGAAAGAGYGLGKILTDPRTARWLYDNQGGQMLTAGNAGKASLSLVNALTVAQQNGSNQAGASTPPPRSPAAATSLDLGVNPAAALSPAALF